MLMDFNILGGPLCIRRASFSVVLIYASESKPSYFPTITKALSLNSFLALVTISAYFFSYESVRVLPNNVISFFNFKYSWGQKIGFHFFKFLPLVMVFDIAPPSCKSGANSKTLKFSRSSVEIEITQDHFSGIFGLPLPLLAPLLIESSRLYLSSSGPNSSSSQSPLESLNGDYLLFFIIFICF